MALHVFYIWFCFLLAVFIYMGLVEWFYNVFGMEPAGLASAGHFFLWVLLYALSFLLPGWLRGHGDGTDSRSLKNNAPRPVILFGIFAGLVSMLWLVAGAGIFGSPVGQAFEYHDRGGSGSGNLSSVLLPFTVLTVQRPPDCSSFQVPCTSLRSSADEAGCFDSESCSAFPESCRTITIFSSGSDLSPCFTWV